MADKIVERDIELEQNFEKGIIDSKELEEEKKRIACPGPPRFPIKKAK